MKIAVAVEEDAILVGGRHVCGKRRQLAQSSFLDICKALRRTVFTSEQIEDVLTEARALFICQSAPAPLADKRNERRRTWDGLKQLFQQNTPAEYSRKSEAAMDGCLNLTKQHEIALLVALKDGGMDRSALTRTDEVVPFNDLLQGRVVTAGKSVRKDQT